MSKLFSRSQKEVVVATTFGSILEWYEIFIYIYWAPVISLHFFNNSTESFIDEIKALMIFAVGFLSRPIGGFLFGHIGDRIGRRGAFIISILTMSIPTIIIGVLPSYGQIGIWAPLLLGLMRVIQGIPAGGELPGTICYLYECASIENRKFMSSFAFFGVGLGVMISIGEYQALQYFFPDVNAESFGWRFSFIFGGLLGIFGFYLRYKLHETPLFHRLQIEGKLLRKPIFFSLSKYKQQLLSAFLCSSLSTVGFYIICVFPTLHFQEGIENENTQLKIIFFLVALSTFTLPIFGKLGDKYSLKQLLRLSGFLILVSLPIFYFLFLQNSIFFLIIGEILLIGLLNIQFALLPSLLVDLFPTHIRYSGVGISFNLCDSLIGGAIPLLAFYLFRITGNVASIVFLIGISAILSLAGLYSIKKHAG